MERLVFVQYAQEAIAMIRLYGLGPIWSLPDISSFVAKVDCYLRMTGSPYEYVRWEASFDWPPKGKFPYIEDDGATIADSGFIIDHLKVKHGDTLDAALSAEQSAVALSMRRMIEEHLYWPLVYSQWCEDDAWEGYKKTLPTLAAQSPAEQDLYRNHVRTQLFEQGTGRHSRAEVYELGNADIRALSAFLDRKQYFMGLQPTSLDATAFAFLTRIMWVPAPFGSPLKTQADALPNLVAYCNRMHERFYGAR